MKKAQKATKAVKASERANCAAAILRVEGEITARVLRIEQLRAEITETEKAVERLRAANLRRGVELANRTTAEFAR